MHLHEFLNKNMLEILEYWFDNGHQVQQLPLNFFGFESLIRFVDKHMKVLVPAEVLWNKQGNFSDSELVPILKQLNKTNEYIIEVSNVYRY